jgi:hypothetical protein
MSLAQLSVRPYSAGPLVSFSAPLAAYSGTNIPLNGVSAASGVVSAAGLLLSPTGVGGNGAAFAVEFMSLCALVQTKLTTSSLVATSVWEVSEDGANWIVFKGLNHAANSAVAAAGTGSLVTTTYVHSFAGVNPAFPYCRLGVAVSGATGGAGDNVIVAYQWRRRAISPIG